MSKAELLTRTEWLALHYDREHMSASQASAALGMNPHTTPLALYATRRGDLPAAEESLAMRLGHMLEPVVAKLYEDETGRPTYDPGEYAIIRHPNAPWLFATLDRRTSRISKRWGDRIMQTVCIPHDVPYEMDSDGALELKTTGSYSKGEWEGDAPLHHQIQLQIQMFCAGLAWGSLAALVGNAHFFWYDYDRQAEDVEWKILERLQDFRKRVMAGNPPDPSRTDLDVVKAMFPTEHGETVDVAGAAEHFRRWRETKAMLKQATQDEAEARAQLILDIGDAAYLHDDGRPLVAYKAQTRKGRLTIGEEWAEAATTAGIPFKRSEGGVIRVMRSIGGEDD